MLTKLSHQVVMLEKKVSKLLPENYSIAEAAEILGCCYGTIRNWILDGSLGSVKRGRKVIIPASEIDTFLERKR